MARTARWVFGVVLGTAVAAGGALADDAVNAAVDPATGAPAGPIEVAALDGTLDGALDETPREAPAPTVELTPDILAAASAVAHPAGGRTFRAKRPRLAPVDRSAAKRGRLERRWRYERNQFSDLIERYAAENDVPAEFAHAIVEIESRFRPNVKGRAGEIGLMQIKPATARLVGFRGPAKALYDPETNIKYGMRYLAKARRLGGESVCGTILKYNAGHAAKRMNRISRAYCNKVKDVLARNSERYRLESLTSYAFLDAPRPRFRQR